MQASGNHPAGTTRAASGAAESVDASAKPKLARISLNVTPATQAAVDRVVEREGVTVTEALRRLVGYGDLVDESTRVTGDDLLIRQGNTIERIVVISVRPCSPPVAARSPTHCPDSFSRPRTVERMALRAESSHRTRR